jgi:hypothetical protein
MTAAKYRPFFIFIGDDGSKSSPLHTWASALRRAGANCDFVDPATLDAWSWAKTLRRCRAIIYQGYRSTPKGYLLRQLAIATTLGVPIIRKWSGTDVLLNLDSEEIRQSTLDFNALVSNNITSEHKGLVAELHSIGIHTTLVPQVLTEPVFTEHTYGPAIPSRVGIYLPNTRFDFYNGQVMEQVIGRNPDISFVVVADESHHFERFPNVDSLGWVDDMSIFWDKIGLLLRITKHDGFARSIVEALSRERYVIHNYPVGPIWLARDSGEINRALRRFKATTTPNTSGKRRLLGQLGSHPESVLLRKILETKPGLRNRLESLVVLFRYARARISSARNDEHLT